MGDSAGGTIWNDLKLVKEVHDITNEYQHWQFIVDVTQFTVCAVILIPSTYVFVRSFAMKERRFFAGLISLVIIGSLSGMAAAVLMEKFFETAKDWKTFYSITKNNPEYLNRLTRSIYWTVGIFFSCFSIAHWVLAIRYWSLAFQLQACCTGKPPINKVLYRSISLTGYILNLMSGLSFTLSFYEYGHEDYKYTTEVLNLAPQMISMLFLIDSLRRFKSLAKGHVRIETTQIVWHVWSFLLFVIGSICLIQCINANVWDNAKKFYLFYENVMIMVFLCEMPFVYVVIKIQWQEFYAKQADKQMEVACEPQELLNNDETGVCSRDDDEVERYLTATGELPDDHQCSRQSDIDQRSTQFDDRRTESDIDRASQLDRRSNNGLEFDQPSHFRGQNNVVKSLFDFYNEEKQATAMNFSNRESENIAPNELTQTDQNILQNILRQSLTNYNI